ncbi:MFS transporter [Streptomyces sp. NPDC058256]|uniref:MFS transporter n=1 Tax=Streptomyces sp. NPDC058256 TaxID=3346408 RepID=UPI0036EB4B9F
MTPIRADAEPPPAATDPSGPALGAATAYRDATAARTPETSTAACPTRYRDVLRVPFATRLLAGTLIGRMPTAMAPLAIVLIAARDGYALAGSLTALYLLANAAGGPLSGRLVDRYGQTRTLTTGALVSGAGFLMLAAAGTSHHGVAAGCVLIAGAAKPPLDAALRTLWAALMPTRDHERVALSLDAATQETIFIGGPLLVVGIAEAASARWALLATAAVGLTGTMMVVSAPPSRSWKPAPQRADWLGPLRSPSLRVLYLAMACAGVPMGALTPLAVQAADRLHDTGLSGTLPAAVSVGALLGGLAYGARSWPGTTAQHLLVLCGGFTVGWLPLLAAGTPTAALTAGILSGLVMAPLLSAAYLQTSALAPAGSATEASALLIAALDIGCAAGTAAAGIATTSALLPAGGGAACLVLLTAHHIGRRQTTPAELTSTETLAHHRR